MSILITICARGGSKGIPGKNIRSIAGRSLLDYSISIAKVFAKKHEGIVALSTDSEQIKAAAANKGIGLMYTRPIHLATDSAGKIDTIKDVLIFEEKKIGKPFEYVLDLDVTSPLRTIEDLETAFEMFLKNDEALNMFSVNKAARNPYFNMVEKKENGFFTLVKSFEGTVLTRQSAPEVYDLNASFYFYRRTFFDSGSKSVMTNRSLIYLMSHTCFDLDHPIDFEFMEYLILNNKLDFELI
ncbi:MAG: acylneuraminate cytidylyltransferase family protein [bacterium]|nr:acylneuraminate cytidylyltransferase family protein [bacterium]